MTRRLSIPVTTPAQTLADLGKSVAAEQLRRATRQAEVLGLTAGDSPDATRSELEHLFLRLCRRHRIPQPEVNVCVDRHLVDFLWRRGRLVVETDGYRHHRGALAFEEDHARDLELRRLGLQVLRFTYRQLTERAGEVAEAVSASLAPSSRMARGKRHSAS